MNLKLQKKLCWFGCVVLSAGQSYGQLPQINNDFSVTPVSPEAAALVKMTEYPVNHNTGIPDIALPLFTAVSGELSLPINMSYHSGGFKVQEIAGYAGLGWVLTCDLQITRVINGLDDFGAGGYLRNTKMKGVVDGSLVQSGTWYPNDDQAVYELATTLDGAPDKFHFRLMNKTGSFYLQKNEQGGFSGFVCDPHEKVKIEVRTEGSTPYFFITDTDGTLYKFGTGGSVDMGNITINDSRKDVGVETSGPSPHQHAVTTWKCIQVSNFNNTATISFEYVNKRERFVPDLNSSIEYWERTDIYGWQNPNMSQVNNGKDGTMTNLQSWLSAIGEKLENLTPRYVLHCPNGYSYTHLPYLSINNSDTTVLTRVFRSETPSVTGRYYTNLAISKIIFDQGEVRFTYDLDAGNFPTILSEIKIVDPEFSELKTIKFLQSYTIDSRMKDAPGQSDFLGVNYLDEIHVQNATKSFENFFFYYNNKQCFGSHIVGGDAWGYKNGFTYSVNYSTEWHKVFGIPKITKNFLSADFKFGGSPFLSNPEYDDPQESELEYPSLEGTTRGVLKKIIYPTGGFVDFEYELNQYEGTINRDGRYYLRPFYGGGLRIKTISYGTSDQGEAVRQKHYKYGQYEDGIGLVRDQPTDNYSVGSMMDGQVYKGTYCTHLHHYYDLAGSPTAIPTYANASLKCTTYFPSSIRNFSYPNGVSAYYTHVSEYEMDGGRDNGKTVYEYYPPGHFESAGYGPTIIWNTTLPVQRTSWYLSALKSVSKYKADEFGQYVLIHKKENTYVPYRPLLSPRVAYSFIVSTRHARKGSFNNADQWKLYGYKYGQNELTIGRLRLSQESERWYEKGRVIGSTTSYGYEGDNVDPCRITYSDSLQTRTISYKYPYDYESQGVYATMNQKNNISTVIEQKTTDQIGKVISIEKVDYSITNGLVVPAKIIKSSSGNQEDITTELTFDRYDAKGNVLQTTDKTGLVTSYLWGYNSTYPVAEVVGKAYSEIAPLVNQTVLNNPTGDAQLKAALAPLHDLENTLANTFTHKLLVGITSQTSPAKTTLSYEYDAIGRLRRVRDDDNNILSETDYKMKNSMTRGSNSYINPERALITQDHSSYFEVYNRFLFGGRIGDTDEDYIYQRWRGSVKDSSRKEIPSSEMVKISFFPNMQIDWPSFPAQNTGKLKINFSQDGQVVYSVWLDLTGVRFPTPVKFDIPKGRYIMNIILPEYYLKRSKRYYQVWYSKPNNQETITNVDLGGSEVELDDKDNYEISILEL